MNNLNLTKKTDADINSVINFIPSAVLWVDQHLKIKDVNDNFLSIMDKSRDQVVGTNLSSYPLQNLNQYFSHIELLRNRSLNILDHFQVEDRKKTVRFYIQEVESESSFLIIGIDLSGEVFRDAAHEEVRRQQEENTRFMLIGQIVAGVAHEINNPLSIISGFLFNMKRSLEKNDLQTSKEYFLDKITKASVNIDRIAMIVRGLKFLSRNDLNSPFQKVHVQELINHTLDICSEKFKASGIELIIDDPEENMIVECRPVQLTQVIVNLLTNSLEALEDTDQKWARLSFQQNEDHFTISIIDSGPGVPSEIIAKIMQPFFTTKISNKGVGLGLSTSNIIVQDHKGKLLYDEASAHTKFDIILKN